MLAFQKGLGLDGLDDVLVVEDGDHGDAEIADLEGHVGGHEDGEGLSNFEEGECGVGGSADVEFKGNSGEADCFLAFGIKD